MTLHCNTTDLSEQGEDGIFDIQYSPRLLNELIQRVSYDPRNLQQQHSKQSIGGFHIQPYHYNDQEQRADEDADDDLDDNVYDDSLLSDKSTMESSIEGNEEYKHIYDLGRQRGYDELRPQFDALTRQQHEQERKWRESEAAREAAEHHQLNDMMQQLEQVRHRIPERELICQPESARVIQCYRENKADPLKCRSFVLLYEHCTQAAKHKTFQQLAH
jgi:hypothetical protein